MPINVEHSPSSAVYGGAMVDAAANDVIAEYMNQLYSQYAQQQYEAGEAAKQRQYGMSYLGKQQAHDTTMQQSQQTFTGEQARLAEAFNAQQALLQRNWQSGESAQQREWQGTQSSYDRAMQAAIAQYQAQASARNQEIASNRPGGGWDFTNTTGTTGIVIGKPVWSGIGDFNAMYDSFAKKYGS
jgi:hypothetical protein